MRVAVVGKGGERAGSPRMTQDLRAANEYCSENRVARRMQVLGLRALAWQL